MAQMIDKIVEGTKSEAIVADYIEKYLSKDVICYYNREVGGLEFDFCLLIKNIGVAFIEVKGWKKEEIVQVETPDRIHLTIYDHPVSSPKKQVRAYRFKYLNILQDDFGINPLVMDFVCYPYMSEADYKRSGLNIVSERKTTILKEDLEKPNEIAKKIYELSKTFSSTHDKMTDKILMTCRKYFETSRNDDTENEPDHYSELRVFSKPISIVDQRDIINAYFNGIKQIIFCGSNDELKLLAQGLSDKFSENHIKPSGVNITTAREREIPDISIENDVIRLFNFEAYAVDGLTAICKENKKIINGRIDDKDFTDIINVIEKTEFNFNQYKLEHAPINNDIEVRAGAGTGKTFSMISRISYLIHERKAGISNISENIVMLTFTRDAASNMKSRLKTRFTNYFILTKNTKYMIYVSEIEKMRISTIHSFTSDIISETSTSLGIGTEFSTVSGSYERNLILDRNLDLYIAKLNKESPLFLANLGIDLYAFKQYISQFADRLYRKGVDIKDTNIDMYGNVLNGNDFMNSIISDVIIKTEKEYSEFLYDNNTVSLKEYMLYLKKCVNDKSFNPVKYPFKYMFIDEFQDVDDAQIEAFIRLQKKLGFKFFIVGDLKQSIYRFRGATMDAFSKMGCDSGSWKQYSLNINYRTHHTLLDQYNELFEIVGSEGLIPFKKGIDDIYSFKGDDDELTAKPQNKKYSEEAQLYDELYEVLINRKNELEQKLATKKLSKNEKTIAILTRTNYEIKKVVSEMSKRGIDVISESGGGLFETQAALDLCKLVSTLINPYDVSYLADLIYSNNVHIEFPLYAVNGIPEEKKREILIDCLDKYYSTIMDKSWSDIVKEAQNEPVLKVLREIYEHSCPWKSFSTNPDMQVYYRSNYDLVFEQLSKINKNSFLTLESINESLHISIFADKETSARSVNDDSSGVQIICTTVHKSKGLEYDTVVLPFTDSSIGLRSKGIDVMSVDNKIGYMISLQDANISNEYYDQDREVIEVRKEETRILYVALTRAINRFVYMSKPSGTLKFTWGKILEDMPCQSE